MISQSHLRLSAPAAIFLALVATSSLSGCSAARREMGFEKAPPDEFAVIAKAPLSQPPEYTLRPPTPGAPRPQEGSPTEKAHDALLGHSAGQTTVSRGETALVAKAGGDHATPEIRRIVDEETTGLIQTSPSFVDKVLFWRDTEPKEVLLNAGQESDRLKSNAAAGKSPDDGASPIISRGNEGSWLPSWF